MHMYEALLWYRCICMCSLEGEIHPALVLPDMVKLFEREDASSLSLGVSGEALDNHGYTL